MKKGVLLLFAIAALVAVTNCNRKPKEKEVYIIAAHQNFGFDGLRYLYSYDGETWDTIMGIFCDATIGNKKKYKDCFTGDSIEPLYCGLSMLRDASILQDPDSVFHVVWTLALDGERRFGYAHSTALIHWSAPRGIHAMADSVTNNVWAPQLLFDDEKGDFVIVWSSAITPDTDAQSLFYTTTKDFIQFAPAQPYEGDGEALTKGAEQYTLPEGYTFGSIIKVKEGVFRRVKYWGENRWKLKQVTRQRREQRNEKLRLEREKLEAQ